MNRKLAQRFFLPALIAVTFSSHQGWAEVSTVPPVRPEVTAKKHPSSRTIFDEYSANEEHQDNAWFMGQVASVSERKYAEISRFLPVDEARGTDSSFRIVFKGNDKDSKYSQADVYGDEVRIYDKFMDIPLAHRSLGLIAHEVAHLLQAPYRDYVPHWMMEAIADYFRYTYQEEQNIYWFLAKTREKLDQMKAVIKSLEEAEINGTPGVTDKLERARKALHDFKTIGYRDNPREPVHSAGLLTLIDDYDQAQKKINYRDRNYKAVRKSADTGAHGEPRIHLEVEVRSKNLKNKLFYVSKIIDKNGSSGFVIDDKGPHAKSILTYEVTTRYERMQEELDTIEGDSNYFPDIPANLFITGLHKEILGHKAQKLPFDSEDLSYYLAGTMGVTLDSFWAEYIARAESNPVPPIDSFNIGVARHIGKNEHTNLVLAAKRAAQMEYIAKGDEFAEKYAWDNHSWLAPYGVRLKKNIWWLLGID